MGHHTRGDASQLRHLPERQRVARPQFGGVGLQLSVIELSGWEGADLGMLNSKKQQQQLCNNIFRFNKMQTQTKNNF
jgi:hypothetical protein